MLLDELAIAKHGREVALERVLVEAIAQPRALLAGVRLHVRQRLEAFHVELVDEMANEWPKSCRFDDEIPFLMFSTCSKKTIWHKIYIIICTLLVADYGRFT